MNEKLIELLSQQMNGNGDASDMPATIMQMFQNMRGNTANQKQGMDEDNAHLMRQLKQAKKTVRILKHQLHSASEFIMHLADFVGACPVCFGLSHVRVGNQIEECPTCLGRYGGPGSRVPDPQLYAWIKPALRKRNPNKTIMSTPEIKQGE